MRVATAERKVVLKVATMVAMRAATRVLPMAVRRVVMMVAMWAKVGDFHTMLSCCHC